MPTRLRFRSIPAVHRYSYLLPILSFASIAVAGCDDGGGAADAASDLAATADLAKPAPRDLAMVLDTDGGIPDLARMPPDFSTPIDMAVLPPNGLVVSTLSTGSFSQPYGVAADTQGAFLWVADYGNHTVQRIDTATGKVVLTAGVAGTAGAANGAAAAATFKSPTGVAVDGAGVVYVADSGNNAIRRIASVNGQWMVTTLAGGNRGTNDGNGVAAQFNQPNGLTTDPMGNVYVADCLNCGVRRITPGGDVTTLIGPDCLSMNTVYYVRSLVRDARGLFYTSDPSNHRIKTLSFPSNVPTSEVYAGPAGVAGTAGWVDGPADMAQFNSPYGVAFDKMGNVVVADQNNHRIRRVIVGMMPAVETVAGIGTPGMTDGASVSQAQFNTPRGVAADGSGAIYVADTGNKSIRKIK